MKPTIVICLLAVFISCREKSKEVKGIDKTESAQKTKPSSYFQDSLLIVQPAAVFFEPDSLQFQKLKATINSNSFETAVHESFFQFKTAKSFLQQNNPAVKIISAKNYRYLVFRTESNSPEIIDLDKISDSWGVYFFKPGRRPRLIDMMSINTEAPNYFQNN